MADQIRFSYARCQYSNAGYTDSYISYVDSRDSCIALSDTDSYTRNIDSYWL